MAESERYIAQFQGHFDAYSKAEGSRQKAKTTNAAFTTKTRRPKEWQSFWLRLS